MKKTFKKVVALCLSLALALSLFCMPAFAQTNEKVSKTSAAEPRIVADFVDAVFAENPGQTFSFTGRYLTAAASATVISGSVDYVIVRVEHWEGGWRDIQGTYILYPNGDTVTLFRDLNINGYGGSNNLFRFTYQTVGSTDGVARVILTPVSY